MKWIVLSKHEGCAYGMANLSTGWTEFEGPANCKIVPGGNG